MKGNVVVVFVFVYKYSGMQSLVSLSDLQCKLSVQPLNWLYTFRTLLLPSAYLLFSIIVIGQPNKERQIIYKSCLLGNDEIFYDFHFYHSVHLYF